MLPTKVGSLTEAASPKGTLSWDTLPSSEHHQRLKPVSVAVLNGMYQELSNRIESTMYQAEGRATIAIKAERL